MKEDKVFGFAFKCRKGLSVVTGKTKYGRKTKDVDEARGREPVSRAWGKTLVLAYPLKSQRMDD